MKNARSRQQNKKSSKGNVLHFMIPGLKKSIDVEYPDGELPVCHRCKKIYKTRELCRIRDGHTEIPWKTTYLCISLDDSCLTFDRMGQLTLVNEEKMQCRFVARVLDGPPLPLQAMKIYEEDKDSPICGPCKKKNYTRYHCRKNQQHSQLPWVTVYVMLSAVPSFEPVSQIGSNTKVPHLLHGMHMSTAFGDGVKSVSRNHVDGVNHMFSDDGVDDIYKVHSSRSFLLTIYGPSQTTLRWLNIDPCVPTTNFKPISTFSGRPAGIMGQRFFPPVTKSNYPDMRDVSKCEQQYYQHPSNYYHQHYSNWIQKNSEEEISSQKHQGSLGSISCNVRPYQQTEEQNFRRQESIYSHGQQYYPQEGLHRSNDVYNNNNHNLSFNQSNLSKREIYRYNTYHNPNGQYSTSCDQQWATAGMTGMPYPPTCQEFGAFQSHTYSTEKSHIKSPLGYGSHANDMPKYDWHEKG